MSCYLVCELGQNMQGALPIALEMVDAAARPYDADRDEELPWRWDAVKTQKRKLDGGELTRSAAEAAYTGRNSFGEDYLSHRQALELSWSDHAAIRERAHSHGLDFIVTLCHPDLVDECPFEPEAYKIASRDLTNVPLLEALAPKNAHKIVSTGMHGPRELEAALTILGHGNVSVLHCISEYPASPENLNLRTIEWLRDTYPEIRVGFSDHTIGLLAGPLAVALGAQVVEKHLTLYRGMRGSDQRGALGPDGAWRYVRNVRQAERMLGEPEMFAHPAANPARRKLERSLASTSDLPAGTLLGSSNLTLLSPGTGVPWSARRMLFGKRVKEDVPGRELVTLDMVVGSS